LERIVGYDVHITRRQNWSDPSGPVISLAEWVAVVESDPEMRLDGYAETRVPDGVLRIEREGLAVWTAQRNKPGNIVWFYFFEGNVAVKNPDPEILKKMWSLARRLDASVQGDEGELYDASGNPI
jgi:hypothetical protein